MCAGETDSLSHMQHINLPDVVHCRGKVHCVMDADMLH